MVGLILCILISYNEKGQATLPNEKEEFMTGYEKIKKFVSEVHEINCALTDEIIEFIDEVIEQEQVGNVAEANACPQLYEGWRDRSDKSYYNEKRILIFTPCYEDITMRWRLIDSQFMDLCIEASHWKKLDEPAFV